MREERGVLESSSSHSAATKSLAASVASAAALARPSFGAAFRSSLAASRVATSLLTTKGVEAVYDVKHGVMVYVVVP